MQFLILILIVILIGSPRTASELIKITIKIRIENHKDIWSVNTNPLAEGKCGWYSSPTFLITRKFNYMNKTIALTIIGGLLAGSAVVNAADITGKVILKGTAPKEKDIPQIKDDPNCGKLHTAAATTHHYIVGANGELANCVVTLVGAKGGGASAAPVVLDQKGCEYTPMIFAVQTGQKITVKNSDPVMHNVHAMPKEGSGNKEENKAQMPGGGDLTFSFPSTEEFLKFQCEVHNWMFSWVTVCDSPYFAVTAPDGTFKISNVPAGKYTVQVSHRKAGKATQEIEVKDGGAKADFTLEAK